MSRSDQLSGDVYNQLLSLKWLCQRRRALLLRQRRRIITTLTTACLLCVCMICFVTIKVIICRFVLNSHVRGLEKLQHVGSLWTHNVDNFNDVEDVARGAVQSQPGFQNINPSEFLLDQQSEEVFEEGDSLSRQHLNTAKTHLFIKTNNSSSDLFPEVFSMTTTMTFNKTLVVHCKESPYIECLPPNLKPIPGKIFKIAYLRRPRWLSKSELDVTGCKINQCVFHQNKVSNDTDLVVIYGVRLKDNFRVPQRWPQQLHALHVWESPFHTRSDYTSNASSPWNHQINTILSYRVDGGGFIPYNKLRFRPKPLATRPNYYEIAKNKTRTAVWIASHCLTRSKREKYVRQMQKYVDVDILGNCGQPCSKSNSKCDDWATKYKFYLAFENSLCTDYVTEKFFKIFDPSIYVIPVVRGGADYDKHFPNFTYINSAHFKTPKDLALHLKRLASDLDTYSKYLEYKNLYQTATWKNVACSICTYVHTHSLPSTSQTYNLQSMLGTSNCRSPTDL